MKFSISLPKNIANEIKAMAKKTDRSFSWWVQKAWLVARSQFVDRKDLALAERSSLDKLLSLRGSLKEPFPGMGSVELSHRAFQKPKK